MSIKMTWMLKESDTSDAGDDKKESIHQGTNIESVAVSEDVNSNDEGKYLAYS